MDVRTLCLGILSLGDASGYEIRKMVAEGSFSFFSEASYGSIYPALTKLTADGLVTCKEMPQDKRPDKKVYSLTDAGRRVLTERLNEGTGPDKHRSAFLAALLFAEAVSPQRVQSLIEERTRQHLGKIERLNALLEEDMSPVSQFVISYGLAMQNAALGYLKSNSRALLENIRPATKGADQS